MRSPLIKFVIALGICAVTLIGYGVWYAVVSAKSAAVADLEHQITTAIETASRISSVRAALSKITGDETVVQNYFVPEASVVAFINGLEARGRSQGSVVNVLSVSAGGEPSQPSLVLTLTSKGTFDAVMRTVGMIEYSPFALSVSDLSLGQDAKNSWHADLRLHVGSIRPSTMGSASDSKTTTP